MFDATKRTKHKGDSCVRSPNDPLRCFFLLLSVVSVKLQPLEKRF